MARTVNLSIEQLQALLDVGPAMSAADPSIVRGEEQINSLLPEVSFAREDIAPPSYAYLAPEDNLHIRLYSSVASVSCALNGRILKPTGIISPFQFTLTPTADRATTEASYFLGEGFLLSCFIISNVTVIQRGQIYALVSLERPSGDYATILRGYLSSRVALSWPSPYSEPMVYGQGNLRSITGTDPAAGAEILETVPTNARWRLRSFRAVLTTSATVATRVPSLVLDQGVASPMFIPPSRTQAASLTRGYSAMPHGVDPATIATEFIWMIGEQLLLPAAGRIRTVTVALQAGDDWGAPVYLVEEWLEP